MGNLLLLIEKQSIPCILVIPIRPKTKRIANRNLRKKSRPSFLYTNIYRRILMNQYAIIMEDEDIIWDDNDWHPNEQI